MFQISKKWSCENIVCLALGALVIVGAVVAVVIASSLTSSTEEIDQQQDA